MCSMRSPVDSQVIPGGQRLPGQDDDLDLFDPNKYLDICNGDNSLEKLPSLPQFPDLPAREDEFSSLCRDVGGPLGDLFLTSDRLLDQVALSPANPRFPDNCKVLKKVREMLLTATELSKIDEPEDFKTMPSLPELDEELAIRVLNIDPAKVSKAPPLK